MEGRVTELFDRVTALEAAVAALAGAPIRSSTPPVVPAIADTAPVTGALPATVVDLLDRGDTFNAVLELKKAAQLSTADARRRISEFQTGRGR